MGRRIIRGITKLSEEEKRRKAFAKKQESDAQQMAALMRLVQERPFSLEIEHDTLRNALMVLYPKAWDTSFKSERTSISGLLAKAHRYFFGRAVDTVAYATNPANVYWALFSAMEREVKAGNHLKESDFVEKHGFLREPPQVTPEDMGYSPAQRESIRRSRTREDVGPVLWQDFIDQIRMRIRRDIPNYSINPDMQVLREMFDSGATVSEAEGSVRARQRLLANVRNERTVTGRRRTDPPLQQVPQRATEFAQHVREATVAAEATMRDRQAAANRARTLSRNAWVAQVMSAIGTIPLTGTAKERLDHMYRLFRRNHTIEVAVSEMLNRFGRS